MYQLIKLKPLLRILTPASCCYTCIPTLSNSLQGILYHSKKKGISSDKIKFIPPSGYTFKTVYLFLADVMFYVM